MRDAMEILLEISFNGMELSYPLRIYLSRNEIIDC